jgi:hypothetical protein
MSIVRHHGVIHVRVIPERTRTFERPRTVVEPLVSSFLCPGPRSSGDRAPPSGGGSAGSNPAGGADKDPVGECVPCGADEVPAALNFRRRRKLPSPGWGRLWAAQQDDARPGLPSNPLPSEGRRADRGPTPLPPLSYRPSDAAAWAGVVLREVSRAGRGGG